MRRWEGRTSVAIVCAAAWLLASGCPDEGTGPLLTPTDGSSLDLVADGDGGVDAPGDAPGDAPLDEGAPDTAPDIGVDTPPDDGPDAVDDVPNDVPGSDAGDDAITDADDAGTDAVPDASPDTPADLPTSDGGLGDVGPDVDPPDAAVDALAEVGQDVGVDAAPDAAPDVAADIAPDIAPDIAADTGPDVGPEVVTGCPANPSCFQPMPGAPGAIVGLQSGAAPTLAGGPVPSGWFQLDSIDFYADSTFNGLVSNESITSNGETGGAIEIIADEWGITADLDLNISMDVVLFGPVNQNLNLTLSGGGCYIVNGPTIEADFLQCGGTFVDGIDPPSMFDYETGNGTLSIMIVLTQEVIVALLPANLQGVAGLALSGDLPFVLNFSQP